MSRLNDLLKELCPNGVEYKALKDFSVYAKNRIDADYVNEENYVGVDNLLPNKMGKTNSSYVPKEGKHIQFLQGDILIGNIRPYLKKIWLATQNGGTNGDVLTIHIVERNVTPEFLYYCLSSDQFFLYDMQHAKGAKMPRGDKVAVMQYRVPVPPLEVQREIVRVLDSFTLLTAELTAELTARKKQYEYYRDSQLEIREDLVRCKLGDICTIKGRIGFRGYTQKDFVEKGSGAISLSPGNIVDNHLYFDNCKYISWEKYEESPEIMISEKDVILCKTGSTVGKVAVVEFLPEKTTLNPQLVVLKKVKCNYRYLFYQLSNESIQQEIKALAGVGSVPNISQKAISNIEIPLPSVEEQERIVKLLDRFDEICNSISSGIPSEITARQKQYEYYRDKLLSFKELGA